MNIERSLTADPLARETTTDYDKLMTNFLASNKSEEYKKLILSMLDYDYSKSFKVKEASVEDEMNEYNATLALKLNGIKFKTFSSMELKKLAKNLWIKNFMKIQKQELIKKIESIKKYFCDKNKE